MISEAALSTLDARISVPAYSRHSLIGGIVHIGVGGFHRAHQAAYLDDLCNAGQCDWSITGAGVLESDSAMAASLAGQDHLYALVTRDEHSTHVRVIGCMTDYILADRDLRELAERIADPATRIVSLTVTEAGYPINEATGTYDAARATTPPRAFEAIAYGLQLRRERGVGGLTVMSCDNVMHNGAAARTMTLAMAHPVSPGLADWIDQNVTFPNSMVDRITPATTQADRDFLLDEYGLDDRCPVFAEPFRQWIIEDDFAAGRPDWDELGALFTSDVTPHEVLKLRLLNAGHSCIAYLAALLGHQHVHEAMADPSISAFLRAFLDREAGAAVPDAPGVDLATYQERLVERFGNPTIKDQVSRLCMDGSAKIPTFILPTVDAQVAAGSGVELSSLAIAGWCQYLLGQTDDGEPIQLASDPHLESAVSFARASVSNPEEFLRFSNVFGHPNSQFAAAFTDALISLRRSGVRSTIADWLKKD